MKNLNEITRDLGVRPCDILIPQDKQTFEKWSVIACDQYTSQPEYWENVSRFTSGTPSTLDIIFPEVYLEDGEPDERILNINRKMEEYLKSDIFQTIKDSFILVDRSFPGEKSRKGLVMAFDLDKYDYAPHASSLIRATEGTVLDRIPPRVRIRANAPLEVPHIMILIDDPGKTVIEPLFNKNLPDVYDFELMQLSGHIKGYAVSEEDDILQVLYALKKLCNGDDPLLFAVGDGNHSLASAKVHWESIKKDITPQEALTHPARYALAELVNLHDDGLVFESINRICFNTDPQEFLKEFKEYFSKKSETGIIQKFKFSYAGLSGEIDIPNCEHTLEIGTLQEFLDYKSSNSDIKIDYIHGEDIVHELSAKPNSIGFLLPAMNKNDLFKSIAASGVLPRKTFSMGESFEKRFYFECRKII